MGKARYAREDDIGATRLDGTTGPTFWAGTITKITTDSIPQEGNTETGLTISCRFTGLAKATRSGGAIPLCIRDVDIGCTRNVCLTVRIGLCIWAAVDGISYAVGVGLGGGIGDPCIGFTQNITRTGTITAGAGSDDQ